MMSKLLIYHSFLEKFGNLTGATVLGLSEFQMKALFCFVFFKDIFGAFCAFISTGQLKSRQETGQREGE